jgi:hypothetical protein
MYALARLPWDRRFQANVIALALGLAAAKNIMQKGTVQEFKSLSAWTERNYLREKRVHPRAAVLTPSSTGV